LFDFDKTDLKAEGK